MLIAGAFVFLGLLTSGDPSPAAYALGSAIVAVVLACWALFAHHYRQLYMLRLTDLWNSSCFMGAQQNRRFNAAADKAILPRFGPRGHDLDLSVFAAMGLEAPGWPSCQGSGPHGLPSRYSQSPEQLCRSASTSGVSELAGQPSTMAFAGSLGAPPHDPSG